MPGKRKFEEQLAALDALRRQPRELAVAPLRKALAQLNNFLVGKAADLVLALNLPELTPELLSAFDRFFEDAIKTDPQCWAKAAIARALAGFDYQEAEPFLRGMKHIQMEPSYGGPSDSAGTLRATCALALVQCRSVREPELLAHLIELLADKDKSVRADACRAIEQVGSSSAALLLRLRAALGSDEPEVLGACYSGVLRIEGAEAIPWVGRFLHPEDDAAAEAALAIASLHSLKGFEVLRDRLESARDPWFVSALLSAIALTRQEQAMGFLLNLVRSESLRSEPAIAALLRAAPTEELVRELEGLVAGNPRLKRAFGANKP